jgi:hypothetical protein
MMKQIMKKMIDVWPSWALSLLAYSIGAILGVLAAFAVYSLL